MIPFLALERFLYTEECIQLAIASEDLHKSLQSEMMHSKFKDVAATGRFRYRGFFHISHDL